LLLKQLFDASGSAWEKHGKTGRAPALRSCSNVQQSGSISEIPMRQVPTLSEWATWLLAGLMMVLA
jgi:hypothetical protein